MFVNLVEFYDNSLYLNNIRLGAIAEAENENCFSLLHDCISSSIKNFGNTNTVEVEIKYIVDTLVESYPYRISDMEKGIIRNTILELLANEIIRESSSPYASPIALVKKKDGDYRMCFDLM